MEQPSLPAQRAFVVQLRAEADVQARRFVGRVEHVVSGQATHFATLEEFVAFVARVLADLDAPSAEALDSGPGVG